MADPKEPKDADQFAKLMAQIAALRSRAAVQLAKRLPPERRQQIADNLRDALNKLTGGKGKGP